MTNRGPGHPNRGCNGRGHSGIGDDPFGDGDTQSRGRGLPGMGCALCPQVGDETCGRGFPKSGMTQSGMWIWNKSRGIIRSGFLPGIWGCPKSGTGIVEDRGYSRRGGDYPSNPGENPIRDDVWDLGIPRLRGCPKSGTGIGGDRG